LPFFLSTLERRQSKSARHTLQVEHGAGWADPAAFPCAALAIRCYVCLQNHFLLDFAETVTKQPNKKTRILHSPNL
jgi:hypothetical protein